MAQKLPIIQRRRIEAELLKEVYQTLVERSGVDEAKAVITESVRRSAINHAKIFAEQAEGGTNLESFIGIQSNWIAENALEIEVVHRDSERFEFNVTRCRYAEMYQEIGLGEVGGLLSCNRDRAFCEGYDSHLKMTRTQTIMEGASHCNFRYRYERK